MIEIQVVPHDDAESLATVTRMCMATVLETIPEFLGSEDVARQYLTNFDFDQMLEMISRSCARPEHRVLVARIGPEIVGYSIFSLKTNDLGARYGYLFSRGVDRAFRRQGIATRLLNEAETWFLQNGATSARAETHEANVALQGLLLRHGFVIAERAVGAWPYVVLLKTFPEAP